MGLGQAGSRQIQHVRGLVCSVIMILLTQGRTCGRQLWLSMFVTRGQQLTLLPGRLPWPAAIAAAADRFPQQMALA